ncbi:hypothetical protein BaRGS_00028671 [Batillaria attramentaria]|uniref:G-protein coupled receptors family 1 profile domain-containing protein n=1 Tax=Batillaria attramentaria TaxID=370345 RepID=A0ABD0JYK1_9CAEN
MTYHSEIITYLVLVPIICIFGIVGNIFTLIVLVRGNFIGAAYVYLKGLAVFDMLGLVFILPISLILCPVCEFESKYALNFYRAYIYICVGDIFLKASVLTTLLLTVERCLVIVFQRRLNLSNQKSNFPVFALIGIFFFAMVENLPTVWAFTINPATGRVRFSSFGKSVAYEVYSWADAVLYQFLPFVVLFTFNVILAVFLIKHRRLRKRLNGSMPSSTLDLRFMSERRTLLMLVGIIAMFLLTMMPCSVMQLIGIGLEYGSDLYRHFQMSVTVLVSVNFSCNFLLYCTLNKRFWFVSKSLLRQCCSCFYSNKILPLNQAPSSVPWHTNNRQTDTKREPHTNFLQRSSENAKSPRCVEADTPSSSQTSMGGDDSEFYQTIYVGPAKRERASSSSQHQQRNSRLQLQTSVGVDATEMHQTVYVGVAETERFPSSSQHQQRSSRLQLETSMGADAREMHQTVHIGSAETEISPPKSPRQHTKKKLGHEYRQGETTNNGFHGLNQSHGSGFRQDNHPQTSCVQNGFLSGSSETVRSSADGSNSRRPGRLSPIVEAKTSTAVSSRESVVVDHRYEEDWC